MKKYTAYAIGAALVDSEVQVSDADLAAMQVEKGVMTLVDQARQRELLNHLTHHLLGAQHASGGSAGNSMIATALFGAPTYMSCKVAQDADGDIYVEDLERCGVDHGFNQGRKDGITGKCLVLVTPDAERSMNTYLGISETLSVDEVNEVAIADAEWVYLEGYLVTSPPCQEAALRTRELACLHGAKIAVSFSDPGMVTFFRDNMVAMVGDGVDLIFCNEIEAKEWAQTEDLQEAFEQLKGSARQFVITRGAQGALGWDGHAVIECAAEPVAAINTNGAGDMFAGAFLYALSRAVSFADAIAFASRSAALVVQQHGPRLDRDTCLKLRRDFFHD